MMGRFIKCGMWKSECRKWRRLCVFLCVVVFFNASPVFADNESLINSPDWAPYQWFASTDKKHENEDYIALKPGETRKIPLVAGELERLWFTAIEPDAIDVSLQNVSYVSQNQSLTVPFARMGKPLNIAHYLVIAHEKAVGFYLVPLTARQAADKTVPFVHLKQNSFLVVTNHSSKSEGNKFFYQASIRSLQNPIAAMQGRHQSVTQKVELPPGGEKTIEITGAGLIETLSLSFDQPSDVQSLILRAAWDGDQKSAVDAPLAALLDLFQHGESVNSAAFDFDGKKANLKWPMPFGKGAKITLQNGGSAPVNVGVQISYIVLAQVPKYRFYAAYGSARTVEKKPVKMLKVAGKGAFCGLNLSITPAPDSGRRTYAYLEGNETITADGKKYEGTGTEDFFSSAWYFPKKPFSFPYHGLTSKTAAPPAVSAYRLMIPDALPFKKSLQFDFEHGNNNNSNDLLFRWVAFWYGEPAMRFEIADALQDNVQRSPSEGPAHLNIFVLALVTALIVGGGGGFIVKMARKRAEKSS